MDSDKSAPMFALGITFAVLWIADYFAERKGRTLLGASAPGVWFTCPVAILLGVWFGRHRLTQSIIEGVGTAIAMAGLCFLVAALGYFSVDVNRPDLYRPAERRTGRLLALASIAAFGLSVLLFRLT